jgi:hypothetical protein
VSSDAPSGTQLGGILGLTFCLPMIFVLVLLQFLGVAEYVYPIIIPIFSGIGVVFIFVFGIIMYAVRSVTRRTMQLDQSFIQSYDAGIASGDYMDQYPPGATYRIPVYCPYCQESVELESVDWIGSSSFVCSNCNSQIRVEVSEE